MPLRPEYRAFVVELFREFGPVTVRPMFGVGGLYAGDVMFGVVEDDHVYLKTDEESRKAFAAEGVQPFVLTTKEGPFVTSYCELPERLYDDPAELALWARRAHEVASRSRAAKKKERAKAKSGTRQPARRRRGG
jgi:DNA transformation protein